MSQYKILKVIGKGAFGDAYLGLHTTQKKQYVIKQVDIKNKSKQQKQHIFNQVKLLQQFNHVNIVSYRDSFIDRKGLLNIVMEYCEGGDMNQIIQAMQGNKIPEDKIVYWLAQIALAIFYMHEKKILHRDLKSPNIFIMKGNIRLGDFGISKVLDHVRDLAQTNIGTPYYMSPEQYNHKPYSYKSDIWAFGCILYEMCNQRRPFQANNIQALGMKVVRGNFPPVSQCYSKDLRNLISDMLLKNPVKRPNIIQILLKPFIKKKVIQYMRQIYSKRQQISKQSLNSLHEQAKKLSITLEEKRPIVIAKEGQSQKQRSQSAKKNRIEQEKEKEKLERQRKKEELQNQLRKQNQQRKEMAEKLKKIQEERKTLLAKKKSEKSIKSIYERVQSSHHGTQRTEYQSEKYSRAETQSKSRRTTTTQESSTNLIGKVLSQVPSHPSEKAHSSLGNNKKQPQKVVDTQKKKPEQIQQSIKQTKPQQIAHPLMTQQKKTFKMEQQYEMEFQDCQPQDDDENYVFSDQEEYEKSNHQREFQVKNRVPTFASDQNKLAMEVKEIQNLVFVSNQAVSQIGKKEMAQSPGVKKDLQEKLDIQVDKLEKKKEEPKIVKQVTTENKPQKEEPKLIKQVTPENKPQKQEPKLVKQVSPENQPQKRQQIKQQKTEKQSQKQQQKQQQAVKSPQQIEQKVETLKQQIKMKTMHINSIRNQLSNIDFQLSSSEQFQDKVSLNPQPVFRKKQFNPQHAKINDRINMLIESANTILGTEMYKKFYEYLETIKEKGRSVKRDYLEQVLGLEKIGAYHLVEQIVRLKRVLDKVPKYL